MGESKKHDIQDLERLARQVRALTLTSIHAAGSGHPGGSLSAADLVTALFFDAMRHDPANPEWPGRDRFILSKAHVVPVLYSALALAGYHKPEDVVTLRKLGSPFQGHTDRLKVRGIEMSGGSLGQGLGISVGEALAAKLRGETHRIFCLMGDGEQQEGSIWEAAMAASHHELDNIVAIVDKNELQIDGRVECVMDVDPLDAKYHAFGWRVIRVDGHDMTAVVDALRRARKSRAKPTVLIARTVKGRGVSFMENVAGWHGKAPDRTQLDNALAEIKAEGFDTARVETLLAGAREFGKKSAERVRAARPQLGRNYWWNETDRMHARMDLTRGGFGKALADLGSDPRVVTLKADISDSIKMLDFEKDHPERKARAISVGIAEQNMMQVAAGLAREGFIPITGTYGVFASGRPWDQIRTTICYGDLNVKIAGAHGGVSVGPDGATHQSLEEISLMSILPRMRVLVPCDALETEKATRFAITEIVGPCYIRYAREATPAITKPETPYVFGKANAIRFRNEADQFADAFETRLAADMPDEHEKLAILACGPMVAEAMRAAWMLKTEKGIETRVLNFHTVKPLDHDAILRAVREVGLLLTIEEHQAGGFGSLVAAAAATDKQAAEPLQMKILGVSDRFGESGAPWELLQSLGLTAESIVSESLKLLGM
ncbi:MAG: transketolase [Candidatus Wallbacteria bacterium]|nr:transketolase [Candidatus Wallbacteria bacterium]